MSDDDRDNDIESDGYESDEWMERSQNSRKSLEFKPKADKRAHHNALERKRRDHIKDSFSSLRDALPALTGEKNENNGNQREGGGKQDRSKASRAQILKKAAEYIQTMRKKNSAHQQDIEDLKRQNKLLEEQIRALEKAKTTGTFATSPVLETSHLNSKGDAISAFDGGSGSESSDTEGSKDGRRKRLKTEPPFRP